MSVEGGMLSEGAVEDARGVMIVPSWPCLFTTCAKRGPRVNGYLCCVECALGQASIEQIRVESRGGFWDPKEATIDDLKAENEALKAAVREVIAAEEAEMNCTGNADEGAVVFHHAQRARSALRRLVEA